MFCAGQIVYSAERSLEVLNGLGVCRPPDIASSCLQPLPGSLLECSRFLVVMRKDLNAVKAFWSDAAEFVFAGDGSILGGSKIWYEKLEWYHQDTAKWNSWEWRKLHVEPLASDAASATVEFENSRNKSTGGTVMVRGAWTYVFKKYGDKWRVIQPNGTHITTEKS